MINYNRFIYFKEGQDEKIYFGVLICAMLISVLPKTNFADEEKK